MANGLMVGLGGTGIKTLLQVKQRLIESNPKGVIPSHVQLLGIDTVSPPEMVQGLYAPVELFNQDQLIGLAPEEFVYQPGYLGGFLGANRNRHLDWMDADWYLNHPQSATILTPEDGPGTHRQVGRLTLMAMLQNATGSPLYQKLWQKLNALNQTGMAQFYLLVFGSLAGGTGASMVGDIPYLVRYIAEQLGMVAKIYGFFALPDAFSHTGQVIVDDAMRARAIAALREMERFNIANDEEIGYQLKYDADGILGFRTKGSAYAITYLFDQRANNPLETNVAYGVCATMASFAWMFTDAGPGTTLAGHLANRSAHLGEIAGNYNGFFPPVCASFGTYSYVLPLGAMVESWTHRFAMEALETLVPRDSNNRILTNRYGEELVTAGGRSVRAVLNEELAPRNRAFIQDLNEIGLVVGAGQVSGESAHHLQRLASRSVSEWIDIIRTPDPTNHQQDIFENMLPENSYLCKVTVGLLGENITVDDNGLVQLEDPKNYGNSSEETARLLMENIQDACTMRYHLWHGVAAERVGTIYEVYTTWLLAKTAAVLNGMGSQDDYSRAIANKAGKLGWWWDFLGELVKGCDGLLRILSVQANAFSTEIESLHTTHVELPRVLRNDASKKNQKKYLKYQQDVFALERMLILLGAEIQLVENIRIYTRELLKQATGYINAIYGDSEVNINGIMQASRDRIDQSRRDSGKFALVREYVYDPEWENTKYVGAIQADPQGVLPMWRVMKDLHWRVAEITDNSDSNNPREVPSLTLEIGGFQMEDHGYLRQNHIDRYKDELQKHEKTTLSTAAVARMVARCRRVFLPVWDMLSVLDYLVDNWNGAAPHSPSNFADKVSKKIGVVLNGLQNQPIAQSLVFYLFPNSTDPAHYNWLTAMNQNLNATLGGQENQYAGLEHSDPTTFTVMSSIDFVDYHRIQFWGYGMARYLKYSAIRTQPPQFYRGLLHVMKPEQIATLFEDAELLHPLIVGLFEHAEDLFLFIAGLVFGYIKLEYKGEGGVYSLTLPPLMGEMDRIGRLITKPFVGLLTQPNKYNGGLVPSLTEAAQIFCLREHIFGLRNDNSDRIPMKELRERLMHIIEQDIAIFSEDHSNHFHLSDDLAAVRREVIKQKYFHWMTNTTEGHDTYIDEMLARFLEAQEHDHNHRLTQYTEIEHQFFKKVVQRIVEYSINHGSIWLGDSFEEFIHLD